MDSWDVVLQGNTELDWIRNDGVQLDLNIGNI